MTEITPEDRLSVLTSSGHGDCLEAIRLRGNDHDELTRYLARLEQGNGTNTNSYRRASKLIGR